MAESFSSRRDKLLKDHEVAFDRVCASVPIGRVPQRKGAAIGPDAGGEPEVKVVKADDGTVQQIIVRCPCGREITLQCEYFGRGDEHERKAS